MLKDVDMADFVFKYQSEIDILVNKGAELPSLFDPQNKCAYRYVFSEVNSNNHKPVYIQKPQRIISDLDKNRFNTSGYALSCFEREDKAIQRYNELRATSRKIALTVGDALCSGTLNGRDGLITQASHEAHFDLYEYESCDLSTTFEIRKILV